MNADAFDVHRLEALKQRSANVVRAPWGFGRDETPRASTQMLLSAPSRREVKIKDELLLLRGGARTALGRQWRSATLWGSRVAEKDYDALVKAMLQAARTYGLVTAGATPFGTDEDAQGWQLQGNVVRFRRTMPTGAKNGLRSARNPYFVALYENLSSVLVEDGRGLPRFEGREHTAQVLGELREIREERFRFESKDERRGWALSRQAA